MFHFFLAGVAIFALQALFAGPPLVRTANDARIVITEGRVRQLAQIFAKTWQRPPAKAELRGLIDAYVKEEVYYREAVRLGLDRDDTLIRRRMQQKMEFLIEPDDAALTPAKGQLRDWLKTHREDFRVPPKVAFEQIFISMERENADGRAADVLQELAAARPGIKPATFGDRSLLPQGLPLTGLDVIARDFGWQFANALTNLPPGKWVGPVRSAYGLHLVRIGAWEDAVDPTLGAIRDDVLRAWRQAQRDAYMESEYERLRAKYEVVAAFGTKKASPE